MGPRDKLQQVGQAMYGNRWKSSLSRMMNVDRRSLRRFLSGERRIPKNLSTKLIKAMQQERARIIKAMDIITSDRVYRGDITQDLIECIVTQYEYLCEKDYKSAFKNIQSAVQNSA
ncbi:TPA: hypothetical protein ACOVJJ_004445 [Klebsiella oxytoca]